MSERAKMLASLRRDGVHDELRAKSKVEKKRRARQAEQQRKKRVQEDGEAAEAVGRLDAAVSVPALRARGSAPLMGLIKRVVDRQQVLQYQARHARVRDRASLLGLVQEHPNGINRAEISDCYDGVWADVEALRIQGKLLQVTRPKALSG